MKDLLPILGQIKIIKVILTYYPKDHSRSSNSSGLYLCVVAVAVRHAHLDAVLRVVELHRDVAVHIGVGAALTHSGDKDGSMQLYQVHLFVNFATGWSWTYALN